MRTKESASSSKISAKTNSDCKVTFEFFAPEAKQVQLAGSFNNWNSAETELKKDKTGRWKVSLSLKPGRYEYRYVVDGSWQNDQKPVAMVRNEYGSTNCVIEVADKAL
jgi:1,4-alpha-glucan branching enzyme